MADFELHREDPLEGRLLLWAANCLTVLLVSAGMIFPCLDAYGVSGAYGFDLGAVLAFCIFGSLCVSAMFTWRHGYWAALAVLAAEGLIFWRLWKHMTEDWILDRLPQLSDLTGEYPGTLFLLYALAILVLGWTVVRARAWWLAAALVILPLLPAFQRGVLPSWGAMLAGFVGWGSMLLTSLFDRRDPGSLGRARLLSMAGMAALVGILVMALPMEGYFRPQWATDARESMIRSVNRRLERFFTAEELENNILAQLGLDLSIAGEGPGSGPGQGGWSGFANATGNVSTQWEDLTAVGPQDHTGWMLLSISTDQPDPAGRIYLRGLVFQSYTGRSWEWVEESGRAQPGLYPALTAPDVPEYTLRIQDTAFRGVWFTPYRFTGGGDMDTSGRLTGTRQMAHVIFPDMPGDVESYAITYRPGGPESGFAPLAGQWEAEEADYSSGEMYRGTAGQVILSQAESAGQEDQVYSTVTLQDSGLYGTYLDVPQELRATLEPLLPEIYQEQVTVDERLPEQFREPVAAAARTASWLESVAVYDPNTPAMGEGEDFVTHFLTEKRGFCVHFATAGAMLLRMQGIPARYVTGYVATLDRQGWSAVRDSDAHAWVEIYLDGYGWYPVEMTPGYNGGLSGVGLAGAPGEPEDIASDPEDLEEDLPSEEEDSHDEEAPDPDVSEEQLPEDGDLPGEEETETRGFAAFWKVLFGIAVFWAVFCAVYLLALLVRRQAREDKNANRSVLNAYGRYKRLRRWGCGQDDELERLANKAKFSQHTLTAEERETAWKCLDENVKQSRVGQPVRRRWLLALLCPIF